MIFVYTKYIQNNSKQIIIRLIVGSDFGFNYWNRFNLTILILEIDLKFDRVNTNLEST